VDSNDANVTVTTPPTTPAGFSASFAPAPGGSGANVSGQNVLHWAASTAGAGIYYYDIERHTVGNIGYVHMDSVPASQVTWTDNAVSGGSAYVYRVRAVDNNGAVSPYSIPDVATAYVFDDDPLNPGTSKTGVKGIHIGQLRQAVDALRRAAGLAPVWTSYAAVTGPVWASDILALRSALDAARFNLLPPASYGTAVLIQGAPIRKSDVEDIRAGVK
jgi:hypothetical protein